MGNKLKKTEKNYNKKYPRAFAGKKIMCIAQKNAILLCIQ